MCKPQIKFKELSNYSTLQTYQDNFSQQEIIKHKYSNLNLTCVAMPAWSIPGTHNVLNPDILRQRIIVSCIPK